MQKDRLIIFLLALGILLSVFIIAGSHLYVQQALQEEPIVYPPDSPYELEDGNESTDESIKPEVFDVPGLRTSDGFSYDEIRTQLNAIEAKYATETVARNKVLHLYVTDPFNLGTSINKDGAEQDGDCCKAIPLYRLNTLTKKYDVVVPDLRKVRGYKENVDEFTYKDYQYIFSWSEDGRYIYFANGHYETAQSGGGMFLDTQDLDRGFQKLPEYFNDWLVSPDKTKAIGVVFTSGSTHEDEYTVVYTYFVVNFNTLKVTPIFVDRVDGSRIVSYATMGMGPDMWPYIQWLNDSTVEFYTMSSDAVDTADQCADVEGENMATCTDNIIKRNFSTLKRHEFSVN